MVINGLQLSFAKSCSFESCGIVLKTVNSIPTLCVFREWNKRMTADQARMLYEKTLKQEQQFAQSFTGLWNANIFLCGHSCFVYAVFC